MKNKKLLAIILLSLSFCFVSGVGYGEVKEWMAESKASFMDVILVIARVSYIMAKPDDFLRVTYNYDSFGRWAENFPAGVRTKGKIVTDILDSRNVFSYKSGEALLRQFKIELFYAYYFIQDVATDMDNDIVVEFTDENGTPYGYFYQGEYHLWED
ncbi:hypothetical protein ES702_06802 [subsurface metagenome]